MAKTYRGIVVVHGVGEHAKGSYLSGFVEELVAFLSHKDALGCSNVQVSTRNRSDTSDTTWATLHLRNPPTGAVGATGPQPPKDAPCPDSEWDEEWHIREAWWTRTFQPTRPRRVFLWGVLAGLALLLAIWKHQVVRSLFTFGGGKRLREWPSERLGRPINRTAHTLEDESNQGVWRQPVPPLWKRLADGLIWLTLTVLWLTVGLAGLVLIGVVYLLLVLPLGLVAPAFANRILQTLMNVIVLNLGDQEAMTTRPVALRAASNEVQTALWQMLSNEGLRARRRQDKDFGGFTTVTIVAHSGGCVVSLAALTSADFARFRDEPLADGLHRPERLNWVTAGSGLNLAWNVRFDGTEATDSIFGEPLCAVNWMNVYARPDPVPQGPPPSEMVEAVVGIDPELEKPRGTTARPSFINLRVVNTDSPWADHGRYWGNHPAVMARVVHLITKDLSASARVEPEDTAVEAKGLAPLQSRIEGLVQKSADKRQVRVTLRMLCILGGVALFVGLCAWKAIDAGRWALGTDKLFGMDPWRPGGRSLGAGVIDRLQAINAGAYADLITGVAFIAFAALIVCEYFVGLALPLLRYSVRHERWHTRILWILGTIAVLASTALVLDLLLIRWPTGQLN